MWKVLLKRRRKKNKKKVVWKTVWKINRNEEKVKVSQNIKKKLI